MPAGPVFIGGLAFSGKTPVRIALSAHPRLCLTRHTAMWTRFGDRFGDLRRPGNLKRCLDAMTTDPAVAALSPDRDRIEREFRVGPPTYYRLFALFHEHHAQQEGKARWGDQMGLLERYAEAVLVADPDAQMIHMIRDPRARLGTGARHRLAGGKLGWETARWCYSADLARRNARRFPGRYRVVRFEDFRADPPGTLADLTGFLGEEDSPAMAAALEGVRLGGEEWTARAEAAGFADDTGGSAFVEHVARRQLAAFGYPVRTRHVSPEGHPFRSAVDWPTDLAGFAMWRTVGPVMSATGWKG